MSIKNTAILIHGPTDNFKEMVNCYSILDNVHWVTWEDEPQKNKNYIIDSKINLYTVSRPPDPGIGNINYMTHKISYGLEKLPKVDSYLIVRQDLIFSNPKSLINLLNKDLSKLWALCFHNHVGGYVVDYFSFGTLEQQANYWNFKSSRRDSCAEIIELENYLNNINADLSRKKENVSKYFNWALPIMLQNNIKTTWYRHNIDITKYLEMSKLYEI